MKAATISEIKKELRLVAPFELAEIILRLAKFKKENKELLTYLLFQADSEEHYVKSVISFINLEFDTIETSNYYYIKKRVRKILKQTKTFIRYSNVKETEVELLLHFCECMMDFKPSIFKNRMLSNLFDRQILLIEKKISVLHEDLQYEYHIQRENLLKNMPSI